MGILRTDRVTGLGGANAIKGSVEFRAAQNLRAEIVNGNADFNLGSSNFTIECWYNPGGDTGTTDEDLLMLWNNTNNRRSYGLYYDNSGYFGFIGSSDGSNSDMGSFHSYNFPDANAWYHLAAVRISNTISVYVNGVLLGSESRSGSLYENTVDNLVIGGQLAGTSYDSKIARGFISNMRLIIGDGIYTGAFTPPTNELTVTPNTKLLCCQSPGNILQEATGKKLIAYRSTKNDSFAQASHFTPNSPVGFSTTTDVGSQYGSTFDGFGSFATSTYMVPPGGNTRERNRGRGLVGGGWNNPSVLAQIYSVEIASDGTSADFGDLTLARRGTGAVASHTRGIWAGGYAPGYQDRIDFVTIASTANAIDFGNLDTTRFESSGVSNDTRGVYGPCENPSADQTVIQYITMATAGNATDFGDSTVATKKQASMNSTTRGLFAGGQNVPSPLAYYDIIDKITIASTGNASDFGDLTENVFMCTGVCDSTRGIRGGGAKSPSPANTNTMDYVTIASDGNAANFGDLTTANQRSAGMSNSIRGLFSGGATPNSSTSVNSIDKITIQTTGNATDFGDYIGTAVTQAAGCSDSHGGLS